MNIVDRFFINRECFYISLVSEFLIPEPDNKLFFHPINLLNITVQPTL